MKLKIVNSAVSILKYYLHNFPIWELFINFDKRINLRIISKKTLRDFWEKHSDSKQQLLSWYQESSKSNWETPNDIKKEYPSASVLLKNRIVFNIKGNTYRLIVKINYEHKIIWIRFIGTHSEYNKIDANKI
ncbi:mRNA interferase HigB [Albibacterium bauzanense]|uniref:mRNA interferase HigB n=1 Tax=Albibacterium bauzanense TaxID=653929 RepID=A0A4R1M113_9SPHI|nr:mRNA interferase HigB [Albibacterium bauzanense]